MIYIGFVIHIKDTRDGRPMAYTGRVVSPLNMGNATIKDNEWLWKDSTLFRLRRTLHEPKQAHAKHMIQMETVNENALPSANASSTHGAQKYAQLGSDCCSQIILSAMDTQPWIV